MSTSFPSQRGCYWDGVYALPANLPGVAAAEVNLKANDFAFVTGQGVWQCTSAAFPATWVSALASASPIVLPFAGAIAPAGLNSTYTADATGSSVAVAPLRYTIPTKWKLKEIRVFVYVNTLVNPTVLTVRKNNGVVATINIAAGVTGLFAATVNVDFDGTTGVDDYIDVFETVTGAGAGTMRMSCICYGTTAGTTGLLNEPIFYYRPGGAADASINMYATFATLFAAAAPYISRNLPFTVNVDLDLAGSPFTVPDAGAFNFGGGATFRGAGLTADPSLPAVLAFDGSTTTINGIREIADNLIFDSVDAGGAIPWVNPTTALLLSNGGGIQGTSARLIQAAALMLDARARATLANAGTAAILVSAAGGCTIRLYDDAVLGVDVVDGAVGTNLQVSKLSPAAQAGAPQAGFLGTFDYFAQSKYALPLADFGAIALPLVAGAYFLHVDSNPALATVADNPYVESQAIGPLRILISAHIWAQLAGVGNVTLTVLVNGVAIPGLTALAVNLANLAGPGYGVYAFAQGVPPQMSGKPLGASDQVSVKITVPALGIAVTPTNIHCRVEAN